MKQIFTVELICLDMVEDRYGIENVKVVCSTRCRPRSTTTKS